MRLNHLPMTRQKSSNNVSGSITVFLSLTGILVMALLGTLLETARYEACGNHAERTLRTSAEALLAEYNRPLYDQYGLFFLEGTGKPYEEVIAEYVGDTLEAADGGEMDFLKGQTEEISVADRVRIGDEKAEPLQREIRQMMLHTLTKKQLKSFLNKTSDITDTDSRARDIEKTVEREQEAAKVDQELLKLMKLVDGISVSEGKVKGSRTFIKMFVTKKKKPQNFGVTQKAVWDAMKPGLDETPLHFDTMKKARFQEKVREALAMTKEAIELSSSLKNTWKATAGKTSEFADHDKRMGEILDSFSVLETNRKILLETQELLSGEVTDETRETLETLWRDYDTESIVFDYTGVEEKGGGENPLDALGAAWGDGLLSLVCEETDKISGKSVDSPDNFAGLYGEQEDSEDYGKRVDDFAREESVELSGVLGAAGDYAMDEFCLDSYIQKRFGSYADRKSSAWKKSLEYQWEYIVSGEKSDKENLEGVLNRILLIRTVVNFAAIYKDGGKKAQAYGAAAAVVGFTGMEPLIRLTQTLILVAWSLVESMVDLAGLLKGRDVPLVKTPDGILTSFPEIFLITRGAVTGRAERFKKSSGKSFGYKEYLLLFLASSGQSVKRYRIMDLIQWDMVKNGYPEFQLGQCVFSLEARGRFSFPSRFFRMPVLEQMLARKIQSYPSSCQVRVSYV